VEDAEGGRWWDEQRIAQLLAEDGPTLYEAVVETP
jgi:hypothetical protein